METIDANIELRLTDRQLNIPAKKPGLLAKLFGSKPLQTAPAGPKDVLIINDKGIKIDRTITDPGTEYEMEQAKEEYLFIPWNQIASAYLGKDKWGGKQEVLSGSMY